MGGSDRLLLCTMQKAEDILTPEGVMEVWLLEAQNVPKMDFFGSGQPYGKYVPNSSDLPLIHCRHSPARAVVLTGDVCLYQTPVSPSCDMSPSSGAPSQTLWARACFPSFGQGRPQLSTSGTGAPPPPPPHLNLWGLLGNPLSALDHWGSGVSCRDSLQCSF